ncbi:MAG: family 10 glycosylhydrolase [Tannerella sp.]|nr:family 10 glycosylhydrolase [Tannerella sp.]
MREITVGLIMFFLLSGRMVAADNDCPKHEIRAVWLATIYGLDWPSRPATGEDGWIRQQQELCAMLDRLKEANFNTVFVQARLRGDVIYRSAIEPVAKVFTGTYGLLPGYDPLAFVIDECHRRGMECHAFFVTFPVGSLKIIDEQGSLSVVKQRPHLCLKYRNEWYLDPGLPETADYILSLVKEIVDNYDVDGIQFDYIRYPGKVFPDENSYRVYGQGRTLEDWRRENINRLMARISERVKSVKPWVQVSSSPVGKYRRYASTPNAGWTAYDDVYQDPRVWLEAGHHDMIVPMMYFHRNEFDPYLDHWLDQAKSRNMVVGLGAYRLNSSEGDWDLSEISGQIDHLRRHGADGCAFFRARFVVDNEKGIYTQLKNHHFRYPAQLPPLTWMNEADRQPAAPHEIRVIREGNRLKLSWDTLPGNCTYTVYYSLTDSLNTEKAQSILATGLRDSELSVIVNGEAERGYLFSVTASNRYRVESRPSYETYYYYSEYEK